MKNIRAVAIRLSLGGMVVFPAPVVVPVLFLGSAFSKKIAIFVIFVATAAPNTPGVYLPISYIILALAVIFSVFRVCHAVRISTKLVAFCLFAVTLQAYGIFRHLLVFPDANGFLEAVATACYSMALITSGVIVGSWLCANRGILNDNVRVVFWLVVASVFAQQLLGPSLLLPAHEVAEYASRSQLSDFNGPGTFRAFGTFLGPNALALFMAFFVFIRDVDKKLDSFWECVFAAVVVGLTYSEAGILLLGLFFALRKFLPSSAVISRLVVSAMMAAATLGVIVMTYVAKYSPLLSDVVGRRSDIYWQMLNDFPLTYYIFGVGPHGWAAYFKDTIGLGVSDPHSFVFSVPGAYGVFGIAFYISISVVLVRGIKGDNDRSTTAASVALALVTFVRDAVTIPLPLGSTPFTFWYWVLFAYVLNCRGPDGRNAVFQAALEKGHDQP
ncbi:hypothetical protein NYO91_00250 [Arhodomonas aquaeolei]|uniref:hypothetical protein n=1 Tax=Arhodomonas aquaeolei TaxID=2369 RepID=UPI00216A68BA|nr:hypothetical protein [Arhodomonas aquaeolei]MCS4502498.1 hypothetical protein [Arhodomonas aquaeolei]